MGSALAMSNAGETKAADIHFLIGEAITQAQGEAGPGSPGAFLLALDTTFSLCASSSALCACMGPDFLLL